MSRHRTLWLAPTALVAATALVGSPAVAQEDPEELVIGFVPSVEAGALVENIQPLADYLTETLGVPVKGFVTNDYTALVTAMETGQAQIGALPPYGLIQAVDRAGAEVILQSERFGSGTYHTQFMTTDPDTYCAEEPVENERQEGERDGPRTSTATAPSGPSTSRPKDPSASRPSRSVEPGTPVSFVRADVGLRLHLPGHHLRDHGHRPRDRHRGRLRGRP